MGFNKIIGTAKTFWQKHFLENSCFAIELECGLYEILNSYFVHTCSSRTDYYMEEKS